jgi:phosphatidylglycerol---prolipoprotein diacylglyceryl transferase
MTTGYIIWNFNPEILPLGPLSIRWYGLLFASGFVFGYFIMQKFFRKEGISNEVLDRLTIYMAMGTVIGARLGHVLFYQPMDYLSDPLEIIKIWHGGLASHGAAIGILIALYLFTRKEKKPYLWILDRVVIVVALAGCMIRTGNLANSEIYGYETKSTYGFVFSRLETERVQKNKMVDKVTYTKVTPDKIIDGKFVPIRMNIKFVNTQKDTLRIANFMNTKVRSILMPDSIDSETGVVYPINQPYTFALKNDIRYSAYTASIIVYGIPKHPTQIYEALSYLLIFFLLYGLFSNEKIKQKQGFIFGLFLITLFGVRFALEFIKENQVSFEDKLPLNMGQWLSLPFILAGIVILIFTLKKKPSNSNA